jgi:hypothetical protein
MADEELEGSAGIGGGGFPVGRKQRIDLIDFDCGQTREDIGQVVLRIEAAAAATGQDRVDDGAAPAGVRMADEK